ncbi:MAG: O-antigen ligase family protein [Acidobacteria bacterium]|nr:O-antigen ligase family protein [Acidobacteriota bacterium]
MALVLPAVLALMPLLIAPGLLFSFDVTPKAVVLLIGVAVALPLLPMGQSRWFRALLAVEAVSLLLSTAFSAHWQLSIAGTNWRRFGLVTQLAVLLFALLVAGSGDRIRLLRAVAAAGIVAALYGVSQYFGWDPLLPAQAYHIGEGEWTIVRPPSTLGYATYFATYLLYVVFAGVALARQDSQRAWRIAGWCAVGLGASAILLSGTRAAILGLAAGALWLRPGRRALRATAALLGCAVLFYFSPAGRKLRSRTRWYVEDPRGGARMLLWRDSLRLGARHGLTGTGLETFSSEFARVQSAELSRAYPAFYHESPHNMFLDAWTSQGVAGLIALLGLAGLGLRAAWKGRSDGGVAALGAGLAAALVAQQFSSFTLTTAVYFYGTVGMLVGLAKSRQPLPHGRGSVDDKGCRAATVRERLRHWIARGPVASALLLFGAQLLAGDWILERVKDSIAAGRVDAAIAAYARFQRWKPIGMSADLWYSRALAWRAWQPALEAAQRAPRTAEDRQNALYNLAVFYGARNDFARTEQALRDAIAAAPNWFKPHWTLAQVLRAAGRTEEARAEASLALDLDGGKDPEVVRTHRELSR